VTGKQPRILGQSLAQQPIVLIQDFLFGHIKLSSVTFTALDMGAHEETLGKESHKMLSHAEHKIFK